MRSVAELAMVCGFADLFGWSREPWRAPHTFRSSFPTENFPQAHGKPELPSV